MGVSPSKRVAQTLSNSSEFNSSCDSVFTDSLSLSQYAFPGIKPYQLLSAAQKLHTLLLNSTPLISKWVPTPPDRAQVDRAYQTVITRRRSSPVRKEGDLEVLDKEEFRMFGVEVFSDAVVSGARGEFLKMVPVGVLGIAGVGVAAKANGKVVAAAIVSYALSAASLAYLGLGG